MRTLLNPKWLLLINSLPIVILFSIFYGQYGIIKSLMSAENIMMWKRFGTALGIIALLNLAYVLYAVARKQLVSSWYAGVALIVYISFLYVYGMHLNAFMPFNVPDWMMPDNIALYTGTFIMPTLIYAIFTLVVQLTPQDKEHKAWKSFLLALLFPVLWYLFSQVVLPMWRFGASDFMMHTAIVLTVAGTVVFLFFLVRGIYILVNQRSGFWRRFGFIWIIVVSILFPLLGLAINNGELFTLFNNKEGGFFGDFSNRWFYILAVINGVLLVLPDAANKTYRMVLFIARSAGFAYTFYFFIVFLPYLPVSAIAIVLIGVGFLMLTPLALFIIHVNTLGKDFSYLQTSFSKKFLLGVAVSAFMILPIVLTIQAVSDNRQLNKGLAYLYNNGYSEETDIDAGALMKTINTIKESKTRSRDLMTEKQAPYLTAYWNWIVLDNLTLSDSKISTLEKVFTGKTSIELQRFDQQQDDVRISKVNTTTKYDTAKQQWISVVDMEITNHDPDAWIAEFATTFNLPPGCWISDYYLYVGDKKEPGILAEKKAAMWIYSEITSANRDPGILFYTGGNTIAFRVFPFQKNETRRTGIEFIHKDPMKLTIDSNVIQLGETSSSQPAIITASADKNMFYIPPAVKATLPVVKRTPYYHFMVDISAGKEKLKDLFLHQIEEMLAKHIISGANTKISLVNWRSESIGGNDNWKEEMKRHTNEGGFYLDRAIRKTLFEGYTNKSNTYPVIVAVTDNMHEAVLEKDFSDMRMSYPEADVFYSLDSKGILQQHRLSANPKNALSDSNTITTVHQVYAYPDAKNPVAYLAADSIASIVTSTTPFTVKENEVKEKSWETGLLLQAASTSEAFYPETADKQWLQQVKYSFMSKILTPVTSYIVVENEAQKAMLMKKQQQVLSGNRNLDPGEDTPRMSEPAWWLVAILGGLLLFRYKRSVRMKF